MSTNGFDYAAAYRRGWTLARLSRRLGWSVARVQRALVAAGVELRPRGPTPRMAARAAAYRRLRAAGWTLQRIGDKYGVTRMAVGQLLKAYE